MAQLQYPVPLAGEAPHPREIVGHHGLDPSRDLRRDCRQSLLPARSTLFSRQQQRVEKGSDIATARFERHQIKDPRHAVELEPQTIDQKHQGSLRNHLWTGLGDKAAQGLAKTIPIRWQRHARAPGEQLAECKTIYEDPMENGCWCPMSRATALPWANGPRVSALSALPSPRTKPTNWGTTTRGFRMLGVHACELAQIASCCPKKNLRFACSASTEFLYPSPV